MSDITNKNDEKRHSISNGAKRSLIKTLRDSIGKEVRIDATIDVIRNQGKVAFIEFKDRSSSIQGVVFGKPEVLEVAKELTEQSAVRVHGVVNERPEKMRNEKAENGDIELEITALEPLAKAEALPFDLNDDFTIETLLDYRPLTMRRERDRAVFKIQHTILRAFREFLIQNDFTEFQAPRLVGGDAEGGAEVFKVEYFKDKEAFLATSPQLYKQMLVGVFERVFTTGQTFRAEKSATSRHLSEITMLDLEMGFVDDHRDVMTLVNELLCAITAEINSQCAKEIALLEVEEARAPEAFPVFTLREVQEIIKKETGEDKTTAPDLDPEDERFICDYAREHHDSDFVFVTHFPTAKRPFYSHVDPDDPTYSRSFDLLFRGLEMCSGGQRVHDYEELKTRIAEKGLDPEKFDFYLQAFKYGIPPHGGIGMGLERLTQKFAGLKNVKEAAMFPRDINRIDVLLSNQHTTDDEDNE